MGKYENQHTFNLLKLVASGGYQWGRLAKMGRDCETFLYSSS